MRIHSLRTVAALVGFGSAGLLMGTTPAAALPAPPAQIWSVTVSARQAWWLAPLNHDGQFQWTRATPTRQAPSTIARWWEPPPTLPVPLATTWRWAAEWTWHRTAMHPSLTPSLHAVWMAAWGRTGPLYATTWTSGIANAPLSTTNPLILTVTWHRGGTHWLTMITVWKETARHQWLGSIATLEAFHMPIAAERQALTTPPRTAVAPKGLSKQAVQRAVRHLAAHPQ